MATHYWLKIFLVTCLTIKIVTLPRPIKEHLSHSKMLFRLSLLLTLALAACNQMASSSDSMDVEIPLGSQTDAQLVTILMNAIDGDQPQIQDEVKQVLKSRYGRLEIEGILNADNFEVVLQTLGFIGSESYWMAQTRHLMSSNLMTPQTLRFLRVLMKYPCYRHSPYGVRFLGEVEEWCLRNLKASLNEEILTFMMEIDYFPATFDMVLSAQWYDLLAHLIAVGNFKLFRMIVADWWNFKVRTNLCVLQDGAGSDRAAVKKISLLTEAIAHDRDDMAWLLSGRTWYFFAFYGQDVRNTDDCQQLFVMIPELASVSWVAPLDQNAARNECGNFICKVNTNYPDHVDAQVLVLTSSFCPLDLERYLQDAIKTKSLNQIMAAAKCNKILPEHMHFIHHAGDFFRPAMNLITQYYKQSDITNLQYRIEGRVVVILAQKDVRFQRRALELLNWYISQMGSKMSYIDILDGLDRVYALHDLEMKVSAELKEVSPHLVKAFTADPATICDCEAFELATFYQEHKLDCFTQELLMRTSKTSQVLIKTAIISMESPFALPFSDTDFVQTSITKVMRTLFEFLSLMVIDESNEAMIRRVIRKIGKFYTICMVNASACENNYELFKLMLSESELDSSECTSLIKLLQSLGNQDMIELLASINGNMLPS